jgi:hypothetical protein
MNEFIVTVAIRVPDSAGEPPEWPTGGIADQFGAEAAILAWSASRGVLNALDEGWEAQVEEDEPVEERTLSDLLREIGYGYLITTEGGDDPQKVFVNDRTGCAVMPDLPAAYATAIAIRIVDDLADLCGVQAYVGTAGRFVHLGDQPDGV